jgi:hypothetical protein
MQALTHECFLQGVVGDLAPTAGSDTVPDSVAALLRRAQLVTGVRPVPFDSTEVVWRTDSPDETLLPDVRVRVLRCAQSEPITLFVVRGHCPASVARLLPIGARARPAQTTLHAAQPARVYVLSPRAAPFQRTCAGPVALPLPSFLL